MVLPSGISTTLPTSSIQTSFIPKPISDQVSKITKTKRPHCLVPSKATASCKATKQNPAASKDDDSKSSINGHLNCSRLDRRDVLIGLGGLYGANNLVIGNDDPFALAAPIPAPNFQECQEATITGSTDRVYCCPPTTPNIIDFKPPKFSKIRYRPAAHTVDADYLAKFTRALQLMKDLPETDPRNFTQQANVHCAYCNGAYNQPGFPYLGSPIQVHFSWLFFPFHRLYLYFFERIMGKLIDDPDFAIPFWNWDAPAGMPMPAIYLNPNSPLYDEKRNPRHLPPRFADLDYQGTDREMSYRDQILSNLTIMYRQMVCQKTPTLFHGMEYLAGKPNSPGMGSIENIPHTPIHRWTGDRDQPHNEDMGNFYSAGRDPIFYAHHGNVDRMWSIWKTLPGPKRNDFTNQDWLDAAFLFYDENANLVRCKVRDCLDTKVLGYDYERVDIPWLRAKPIPRKFAKKKGVRPNGQAIAAEIRNKNVIRNAFPIVLDKIVRVEIPRPKKSRSRIEKEDEEEVLSFEGIELERDVAVKFDVYINDEDDETPIGPQDSEFAGSFTNLPHGHDGMMKLYTSLSLPLTDLLEDLDVDGDDAIVVTLVPKEGKGLVSIENIRIGYIRE